MTERQPIHDRGAEIYDLDEYRSSRPRPMYEGNATVYQLGKYIAQRIEFIEILESLTGLADDKKIIENAARINNVYAGKNLPLIPGANAKNAEPIDMILFEDPRVRIEKGMQELNDLVHEHPDNH